MRLRLRSKLLIGVLIYMALLAAVALPGVLAAQASLDAMHAAVDHHVREVSLVGQLAADVNLSQSNLLLHALSSSPEEEHRYEQELSRLATEVDSTLDELLQIQQRFNDRVDIDRLQTFRGAWNEFEHVQNDQFLPLSREQRNQQAYALAQDGGPLDESFDDVSTQLETLQQLLPSESQERLELAQQDFERNRDLLIAIFVVVGLVGVALGLSQATGLARAIEALSQGARRVSQGNFGQPVRVHTGDELQGLAESFNVMTAELKRMREEQEAVEQLKDDFVSMVSHELRTPMNSVIGMSDLLLRRPLGPSERQYAQAVQRAGESLLTIINDILDLSKIEAGKIELDTHPLDVRDLVEDVLDLLANAAHTKELELVGTVDPAVPASVRADATRLRQILGNLVDNAVKFTRSGHVQVRAEVAGMTADTVRLQFTVADTGIGITPGAASHLFEPFFQADASGTRQYGGTGLGLAICKRLVQLMGGDISVESTPDRGSTFRFSVSCARDPGPTSPATLGLDRARGRRILLVVESPILRAALRDQLTSEGVRTDDATDAQHALDLLRRGVAEADPFAIALVDRQLRGDDGLQLAQAIRNEPPLDGAALVLLSPLGEAVAPETIETAGFVAVLEKPVRRVRLAEVVAQVMGTPVGTGVPSRNRRDHYRQVDGGLVLVVDDMPMSQEVARQMLLELGCRVEVVANGREAVTVLSADAADRYGLVLMDCQMPELDGFQATAAIRRRESETHRHVPIVAMTASATSANREQCLAAGMDDFVAKPVRLPELARALSRWLPASNAVSIDRERLASLEQRLDSDGKAGLLNELLTMFRSQAPALLESLRQAVQQQDPVALRAVAHKLKGNAGVIGAAEVTQLCSRLEQIGSSDSTSNAAELVDALTVALGRVDAAIGVRP
jgi:two-component system, sensor histidine kinase and response regulator